MKEGGNSGRRLEKRKNVKSRKITLRKDESQEGEKAEGECYRPGRSKNACRGSAKTIRSIPMLSTTGQREETENGPWSSGGGHTPQRKPAAVESNCSLRGEGHEDASPGIQAWLVRPQKPSDPGNTRKKCYVEWAQENCRIGGQRGSKVAGGRSLWKELGKPNGGETITSLMKD